MTLPVLHDEHTGLLYQGTPGDAQLRREAASILEKQNYSVVGRHSAVKVCGWTKNMIRGRGGCYKLLFYGIMSHQCMQMTTSMSCANRCTFCWRGYKAPVSKEWVWGVDDPEYIIAESRTAHHKFLTGFGGSDTADQSLYEESKDVKHVALSLTGEPITYPRINEICKDFHTQGISTFLVTNAQYPEAIEALGDVTQLYLSIDAPNKALLKTVDNPLFKDYYERMLRSLDALKQKRYRTCVRLTAIKNINMVEPQNYASLITRGDPDFVEVKAYMYVGESRERLEMSNMPLHEEVRAFAKQLLSHLPEYEWLAEHEPSRVVCLAKKEWERRTWIDFDAFTQHVKSGQPFTKWDYQRRDVVPRDRLFSSSNAPRDAC